MTIRVFVVDDQRLVRQGCVMLIDAQPDLTVVGEADDGAQALDALARTPADVVLMDVRMPRLDGVAATRALLERPAPVPRVLVLTTFDLDEYAFAALRAGASGFLLKDAPADELLAAIRTVYRGDAVIAPTTTRRLLDHVAAGLPVDGGGDPLGPLTARERDVLRAVVRGLTNAEAADELFLSPGTVKVHVARILGKLGLRDRVHLVIWAYQHHVAG
ncbi:response regulator transcription factor [Micromonospora sp. NPDC050200]|uniref:response regulator transcription factor n=1 Tax=Micromonospora sp. NPDC050200 TaxID=3155664 RepID=UPI0033D7BA98